MEMIEIDNELLESTDIIHNWIIQLLISSFIAHGFLDFITFFPKFSDNISWYTSLTILFTLLMINIPSISILFFIGVSMYHFGEDFRYMFSNKKETTRWGGATLFGSSVIFGFNTWKETLIWMNVSNPEILCYSVLFMIVPSLFHICDSPYSIIVPFIIGLGRPSPALILYATCIHSPLAIYRYIKNINNKYEKIGCITIWLSGTIIVFIFYPYIENIISPLTINVGIGIVMSHVLYVTGWQINNLENKIS